MSRRSLRRSAVLVFALSLVIPAQALAITWAPAVPITDSGLAAAWAGSMSVTGTSGVQVAYRELVNGSPQVYVRRSTDGGATWAPPQRLTGPGGTAPSLASSGNTVDLVWRQHAADGTVKIKYRRSADAGASWTGAVTLASLPSSGFPIPRVARDSSGRVAVAWTNPSTGKVFVKVSVDGGNSFATGVSVGVTTSRPWEEAPTARDAFPDLAIASGKVYVTFFSSPSVLQLRRSSNSGASWSAPQTLATNGSGWLPSIAASGKTVLVGYAIYSGDDIWSVVRRSADGGLTWASAKALSSRTSPTSYQPIITTRGGVWRAVFERCTAEECWGSAALYRESVDGGQTWSAASRATPAGVEYAYPVGVNASAGHSIIGYEEWVTVTEASDIMVRRTAD